MYQTSIGGHNMRTFNIYPEVRGVPTNYSIVPPPEVKGFPEYLRAQGYYCTNNQKTDYQFEAPPTMWDENGSSAHYRNRAEGQPFFAVFNAMITHESQIWERAHKPLRVDPSAVKIPPFYPDSDSVRLDIARHYTNISEMDEWVGEKLRELHDLGELENTIIFFWSDHGDGLPFFKREITDRGLHVPLIIRYPQKQNSGTLIHDLVSLIDLGPTTLSLAEIQPPNYMQGQAFAGAFKAQPRSYIFGARDRMDVPVDRVRSVRDKRFRYVKNFHPELPAYQPIGYRLQQGGMREILRKKDANELNATQMQWFKTPKPAEEFYVLESDPWELNNVADDPAYQQDLIRLRNALNQWINETNDLGRTPEPLMLKAMWNNGDEPPQTSDPLVTEKKGIVTISVKTPGASIGYRLASGENEKGKSWKVYERPFKIPAGTKITVVAQRIGYKRSSEVMFESNSK
jgi:arylsulfatase A-like enzyme